MLRSEVGPTGRSLGHCGGSKGLRHFYVTLSWISGVECCKRISLALPLLSDTLWSLILIFSLSAMKSPWSQCDVSTMPWTSRILNQIKHFSLWVLALWYSVIIMGDWTIWTQEMQETHICLSSVCYLPYARLPGKANHQMLKQQHISNKKSAYRQ